MPASRKLDLCLLPTPEKKSRVGPFPEDEIRYLDTECHTAVFSIIIFSTLAIPNRLFSPGLPAIHRYRRSLQKVMSKLTGAPSGGGVCLTPEEPVEVEETHGLEDQVSQVSASRGL